MSPASKDVLLALTLLTLLALSLRNVIVVAEDVTSIHTPDFPDRLSNILNETANMISYSEYFQIIKEFFDLANNNVSFNELLKNPATSEDLNKLINLLSERGDLENTHKIEALRDYSSLSLQELLQSISSDELRNLLQRALESSSLNEEILKEISGLYLSGNISFDDYVKALYFLKEVSGSSELATKVDSLLMNTLLNSLTDSSLKVLSDVSLDSRLLESSVVSETLKSMLSFFSREPSVNKGLTNVLESFLEGMNTPSPSVPRVRFPQFSIGLHMLVTSFSVEPTIIIFLSVMILSSVIVYLLLKRKKFTTVLARLPVIRDYFLEGLNIRSEVVRIYWGSVELLKKRVPIFPNETHREYLDKVLKSVPNVGELFERITEAYERVRWGAQEEKLFIHNAQKAYEDLVRELSRI